MTTLDSLLDGIVADPDPAAWLILADWLEDQDDPRRAELLRLHRELVRTCCDPDGHPERAGQQARVVELLAAGVRPVVPRRTVTLADGVGMEFAWVPPGTFLMGSPEGEGRSDSETRHRVTLTRGFWLGVHQVTQAQWKVVLGSDPSRFKGDSLPVETISWLDCQEFLEKLGQKAGTRFRLPTEAEREHACRAGTSTPFFWGQTISTDQANYDGTYAYGQGTKGVDRRTTTQAGTFPPNAWGLFDLHGNVREWCQDWYEGYPPGDAVDPRGESGETRVLRGGSWFHQPRICRSADRGGYYPAYRDDTFGCRVVLDSP